ncbi:Phosphoinositide polyphosphatase Sac family [Pyrenophora tritici-repentis]|uniref:Phosphoinositide polyphosphatase (Sac family) n=2 Tax=Pyrenophora tritici-repentis TaxID=45151 RepID=A0A2W1GF95_9PLEO|nr:SacI domain containing protein [Pyrenophora tritici-repentis Pt-1C-BFP]KAA8621319.1 SacI domain-containing protein [Pyrenophora tritici-repentis]EDU43700.1 SacI domain containing protein [Pyrenophora tritici-repentis Pt-1C-BFP]KAF7450553.1 SacI domain containing protein [Pyrenophora tritici-repentis]KAF7573171.1 Phosphoinositide polyphosphatase (Sac family) [Pyrenophora tritici-repentis]KAG9381225.1 SacI domain containing protein [Pyrenophora tritici-repentis]
MPSLVRKLLIFAAVDGLILQPYPPRNHAPTTQQAIKVDYKGQVGPLLKDRREENIAPTSVEAHGIIGLLKVATSYFLISISDREQVAIIRGRPIYKITDVALIPLSSQADADKAITATRDHLRRRNKVPGLDDDETDSESDDNAPSVSDSIVEESPPENNEVKSPVIGWTGSPHPKTSVAEDVMQRKGVYGRFADKWFSRKGWSADNRRLQGFSSEENLAAKNAASMPKTEEQPKGESKPDAIPTEDANVPEPVSPEAIPKALGGEKNTTTIVLLPKILQTTKMYFSSGNFFYSYDYDISHGIGQQQSTPSVALFKQFDPLFFWNQHIVSPFIDAGQHSFVLPIIQGFVGQRSFTIKAADDNSSSLVVDPHATPDDIQLQSWHEKQQQDSQSDPVESYQDPTGEASLASGKDFVLTLISRRSMKRAGLRYLRRGTDDEGCTANTVETEQILSTPTFDTTQDKIFSFTQLRGSIPLFFSQSPYSLKPQVTTWGSFETNALAFKRHFYDLSSRYGDIYCDSLIDKHGTEAKIGELYEQHAKSLNENGGIDGKGKQLGFEWFDFHNVCRGMRFENVSKLMDSIEPFMKSSSWVEISNDQIQQRQSGILRTNCMDCLDRTNVVQSACARTALEAQLSIGSYNIDLQNDPSTSWFNTLWADNGDAISRQYAGTAALKGDFTRTRKRQITGALTDFGLTLTRYYNNIVNDYFAQALIDYLLGRVTDTIFAEFEADMKSSDYFIDVRKVRQQAIERSAGIVIEDHDEDLVQGWTLSVPTAANQVKTTTFEEAVLLLTEKALYFCRLDWGTEKVREFERIPLENIQGLMRGTYVTSTLAQRYTDTDKNIGLIIQYRADTKGELVRRNTRALDSASINGESSEEPAKKDQKDAAGRFLAFKALPSRSSVPSSPGETPENEGEVVKSVCDEIVRVANKARKGGVDEDRVLEVKEKDIISLADAKKTTGYLEQFEYSLKKLVWG